MAGLIPLSHGSMKIKGLEPDNARSYIGYVPQNNQINRNFTLTVRQVVEMGLIKRNTLNIFSNKKNNQLIEDSLSKVGLLDRVEENITNLSGGQLQRVLLARTLTQGADILLLDEAFSAVDIGAEIDLMKIINDIKEDGKTILIATHDIQNIEEKFDEVLCLNRHCCAFGEPSEVLTQEIIEEMYGSHNQILKGHIPGNHGANSGN